jgi:hypothetical protein
MSFVGDIFDRKKGVGWQAGSTDLVNPGFDESNLVSQRKLTNNVLSGNQDFLSALAAQGGVQNQAQVFAQQQALASQLQDQANGNGPNPALAQLANTTGQNVSQQAALMGSQRGAGANAGLMARQAAMQGGAIQQQSAGQAAVLRAQQQLAAQQALQQQQSMMGQMSSQQVGQESSFRNNLANERLGFYGAMQNAAAARNNAAVQMQQNINNANASIAGINANGQQQLFGGFLSGLSGGGASGASGGGGGGMSSMMGGGGGGGASEGAAAAAARGGMVTHNYADGGEVQGFSMPNLGDSSFGVKNTPVAPQQSFQQPQFGSQFASGPAPYGLAPTSNSTDEANSFTAKILKSLDDKSNTSLASSSIAPSDGSGAKALHKGAYDQGKAIRTLATMGFGGATGGRVPGKADVGGNSLKNDKVPAMLSPGEIVIPRSVVNSEDAPEKARAFVEAVLRRHQMRK